MVWTSSSSPHPPGTVEDNNHQIKIVIVTLYACRSSLPPSELIVIVTVSACRSSLPPSELIVMVTV